MSAGPVAYMAKNHVAANLLMLALLVGGALMVPEIKQETFPEFEVDLLRVTVPYPGASPAEVEQSIVLAIEDEVRSIEGVKQVTAVASEGSGVVVIELERNINKDRALTDVKSAVDRIPSFPEEAERPIVNAVAMRRQVIDVVLYGDVPEASLRQLAEETRAELLAMPEISFVELGGVRPQEISIEVPQASLRSHGLTLDEIARSVRAASVELPGGGVKTDKGELLLRTAERRDFGREYEQIVLEGSASGAEVRLGSIAEVIDGFADTDERDSYDGKRAARITCYRGGDATPIEISERVKAFAAEKQAALPPGVRITTWNDRSEDFRDRMNLMVDNGYLGLVLVFAILTLFLEIRLAFWVALGIPVSFLGAMLVLPVFGATISMISLTAFIIVLGIVVDDAIVIGENVYRLREMGVPPLEAAIRGATEIGVPVIFSVLTTLATFAPLLFITGTMGKFMWVIPVIVMSVLTVSLVESLFILPAHLATTPLEPRWALTRAILKQQKVFGRLFDRFADGVYLPIVQFATEWRFLTIALAIATLLSGLGLVAGGRIAISFLPRIDSDQVTVNIVMPFGTAIADTEKVQKRVVEAGLAALAELGDGAQVSRGMYASAGRAMSRRGGGGSGGHLAGVEVMLVPSDQRDFTASELANTWRERVGEIPGVKSLAFRYQTGPGGGGGITVQLMHEDIKVLHRAAEHTARLLASFEGVRDVDSGFDLGKPQLDFTLKPAARALGITEVELARQVRSAFFGSTALRQQRGREELRVMVRLPVAERKTEGDVEALVLRSPRGGEIALSEAAEVKRGRSYTSIQRVDGRRSVVVTGAIEEGKANTEQVNEKLLAEVMPEVLSEFAGLAFSLEGDDRERRESLKSMADGFKIAMLVVFALLAVPLKSYIQPAIIMLAIPFGIVGALVGHLALGYDLSLISFMGMIALSGVTVNDSLVLVVAVNDARRSGQSAREAVRSAGRLRLRPILLTSFTTFFGLTPMIFETSVQARFLIPMALSLGFGVLFSTFVILLLVPALYVALEDTREWLFGPKKAPVDLTA